MLSCTKLYGFPTLGALLCWVSLVLPGMLIALGCLPFWVEIRENTKVKRALKGVNAAAAGLMGGAVVVLWQTLIGGPGLEPTDANARVALTMLFFAWQFTLTSTKPYFVILLALILGGVRVLVENES